MSNGRRWWCYHLLRYTIILKALTRWLMFYHTLISKIIFPVKLKNKFLGETYIVKTSLSAWHSGTFYTICWKTSFYTRTLLIWTIISLPGSKLSNDCWLNIFTGLIKGPEKNSKIMKRYMIYSYCMIWYCKALAWDMKCVKSIWFIFANIYKVKLYWIFHVGVAWTYDI